jgi:hypothetical protein
MRNQQKRIFGSALALNKIKITPRSACLIPKQQTHPCKEIENIRITRPSSSNHRKTASTNPFVPTKKNLTSRNTLTRTQSKENNFEIIDQKIGCESTRNDISIQKKYLHLVEKYEQQGKLVQVLEEQLSGLTGMIEECSEENQNLITMMKQKELQESKYNQELENLRKELANEKKEKERAIEEKNVQEQIVQSLNLKLSV